MEPLYIEEDIRPGYYNDCLRETPWENRLAPRAECFMALKELEYTYGERFPRTYFSKPMSRFVTDVMNCINDDYQTSYNVCFLNYYSNHQQHLGWHADDSPGMDLDHPIAVISIGVVREIWYKKKGEKGNIPPEQKILLGDGSLFIMPKDFQRDHLHKIPKHSAVCSGRISLTFRKYKPESA